MTDEHPSRRSFLDRAALAGAGIYSEGGLGSAGSTGRGEANLLTCGSHTIMEHLRQGKSPEEACLLALRRIAEKTHLVPRHRDAKGRPRFNVNFTCVDARGRAAWAATWSGSKHVFGDNQGVKIFDSAYLYKRDG